MGLDPDQEYTIFVNTLSCPTRGQGCDQSGGDIRNPADCAAQGAQGVLATTNALTRKSSSPVEGYLDLVWIQVCSPFYSRLALTFH